MTKDQQDTLPQANGEPSDYLKLDNQLCFPLYASSRLITRHYQPLLEKLGLTYPQYIVMLVLWETPELSVKALGQRLQLNTNTLTPLLKRMAETGLIKRTRSGTDERVVLVSLSDQGLALKKPAQEIPAELMAMLKFPIEKAAALKKLLDDLLQSLSSEPAP